MHGYDESMNIDNTYMDTLNSTNDTKIDENHEYDILENERNSSSADEFTDYEPSNYDVRHSNYNANLVDDQNVHDAKLKAPNLLRETGKIS